MRVSFDADCFKFFYKYITVQHNYQMPWLTERVLHLCVLYYLEKYTFNFFQTNKMVLTVDFPFIKINLLEFNVVLVYRKCSVYDKNGLQIPFP